MEAESSKPFAHHNFNKMTKISKNRKLALSKYDSTKSYSLAEAAKLVKEITTAKFDASIGFTLILEFQIFDL